MRDRLAILALVTDNQQAISTSALVPGYSTKVNGVPFPAIADAWGNPIIYVPPGGLTGVNVGGHPVTIISPDHRGFWASAGPDGNFANGDDNIYSFEH